MLHRKAISCKDIFADSVFLELDFNSSLDDVMTVLFLSKDAGVNSKCALFGLAVSYSVRLVPH